MDQVAGGGFGRKTVLDVSGVWCLLACHPGGHVKCGVVYLSPRSKEGSELEYKCGHLQHKCIVKSRGKDRITRSV